MSALLNRMHACTAAALLVLAAAPAAAQRAGGTVRSVRADLADAAQGHFSGAMLANGDAERFPVRVTVVKVAPNRIRVTSDSPRLRAFTVHLVRATGAIRNGDGEPEFLLDLLKAPPVLTVTVDGVSWSGNPDAPRPRGAGIREP
ncbi:MAG TPA: hypothetical protein VEA61_03805 [Allosphingosinicella sp.]|nr:hypothetical protein [Allosphingosinicella sp.]